MSLPKFRSGSDNIGEPLASDYNEGGWFLWGFLFRVFYVEHLEMKRLVTFSVLVVCVLSGMGQVGMVNAGGPGCKPVICAPPPPVEVSWCVEDPCTCCKYTVTACLSACCQCETPCLVGWKPGLLGRKVLTYKFPCGECVEVVITKHGKTIVRT